MKHEQLNAKSTYENNTLTNLPTYLSWMPDSALTRLRLSMVLEARPYPVGDEGKQRANPSFCAFHNDFSLGA